MNRRVVILGAGGHAKVLCDALRLSGYHVLGFLDDNPELIGTKLLGLFVLGTNDSVVTLDIEGAIVGIGDKRLRQSFYERLAKWGVCAVNAIHPSAVMSESAKLGSGVAVLANVVVGPGALVGNDVILNTASTVDHDCVIGDHVHIGPGVHLCGGVRVGDQTVVGVGASVLPYKTIGSEVIVGGGALVLRTLQITRPRLAFPPG